VRSTFRGYFAFFLAVFFAFFAFFAFLAMLPSIPKLVQCKSSTDVQMIAYTTIAKLILRASNKVNGACHREYTTASRDA